MSRSLGRGASPAHIPAPLPLQPQEAQWLCRLADEKTEAQRSSEACQLVAVEGSGWGLPASRLCALCPSTGYLGPCPVICSKAGVFSVLRAVPGLCGPPYEFVIGKESERWAHTAAPWRAPVWPTSSHLLTGDEGTQQAPRGPSGDWQVTWKEATPP